MKKLLKNIKNRFTKADGSTRGLIYLFGTWGLYFLIIWPKMLFNGPDGIYAGYFGVWSDWASHFAYAKVFALKSIQNWLTTHPLYFDENFIYPFIPDAISGFLMRLGFGNVASFILPSIVVSLLLLYVMYKFYMLFTKSPKQTNLAITLFFTSGGLGFMWFIADIFKNLDTIEMFFPREYTRMPENHIHWIAILPGQMLAQRSLLFGFPILISLIIFFYKSYTHKFAKTKYLSLALSGLISSFLLIIHVHSFILLFIIIATTAIYYLVENISSIVSSNNRPRQLLKTLAPWLVYGFSTFVFSLPTYLIMYKDNISSGFASWHPGWIAKSENVNFVYFWILNWGVVLPFFLISYWKTKSYKNPIVTSGIVVFVLCNLFLFQPWDWDNTKLFNWSNLVFSIPIVKYLSYLWHKTSCIAKQSVVLLLILMIFSGTIDNIRLLNTPKLQAMLWSYDDIQLAEELKSISHENDRILVSDRVNNWVTDLTGRRVLMGYRGWLWSYGINYEKTYQDLQNIYKGGEFSLYLLKEYNIKFVVIGPTELYEYNANEEFFKDNFPLVLQNKENRVYKILLLE